VVWFSAAIRPLVCGLALLAPISLLLTSGIYASEVSGRILIQGKASQKTVAPVVYDLRGANVPDGSPIRGNGSAFDRVAVWLESNAVIPGEPGGTANARMQQRNRHFEPELLIVPVGATVEFPNSDPIFHNIFSLSRVQAFDLGYYPEGQSRTVTFPRSGIVQVYCHVHPGMYGVIIVTSSPWTSKPAKDGSFAWRDVPPGRYRLMIWNRSTGLAHKKVIVPSQGTAEVSVAIPQEDLEQ
jgi:plastocyanin